MNALPILLLVMFLTACTSTKVRDDIPPRQTGKETYSDQSLCNLYLRAEEENLWGQLIRIDGVRHTDRQSYGWIKAQCKKGEVGGIEFSRILTLNRAGLELMAENERKKCGEKAFCAYVARVVVVGRLSKDENSTYGMVIDPVEVQVFEVLE